MRTIILSVLFMMPSLISAQDIMPIDSVKREKTIVAYSVPISGFVVENNGNLMITSINTITINSPFEVQLGGKLYICTTTPSPIIFVYDNSGNRIVRKLDD